MKTVYMLMVCLSVSLTLITAALPGQAAQVASTGLQNSEQRTQMPAWPRQISEKGDTITIYQPNFDSWQNNQLIGRMIVSVQDIASPTPTYGILWISAHTEVDQPAASQK